MILFMLTASFSGQGMTVSDSTCDQHHSGASNIAVNDIEDTELHAMMEKMDCCESDISRCADCNCVAHACSPSIALYHNDDLALTLKQQLTKSIFISGEIKRISLSLYKPPIQA